MASLLSWLTRDGWLHTGQEVTARLRRTMAGTNLLRRTGLKACVDRLILFLLLFQSLAGCAGMVKALGVARKEIVLVYEEGGPFYPPQVRSYPSTYSFYHVVQSEFRNETLYPIQDPLEFAEVARNRGLPISVLFEGHVPLGLRRPAVYHLSWPDDRLADVLALCRDMGITHLVKVKYNSSKVEPSKSVLVVSADVVGYNVPVGEVSFIRSLSGRSLRMDDRGYTVGLTSELNYPMVFSHAVRGIVSQIANILSSLEIPEIRRQAPTTMATPHEQQEVRTPLTQASLPTWSIGDAWIFRWSGPHGTGMRKSIIVREEVTPTGSCYVMNTDGRETYYTRDGLGWQMEKDGNALLSRASPPIHQFSWPLESGKSWTDRYLWEDATGKTEERYQSYTVENQALVTTPAGAFESFHVAVRDNGGALIAEYWFAPAVKWVVMEKQHYSDGVIILELTEHKTAP